MKMNISDLTYDCRRENNEEDIFVYRNEINITRHFLVISLLDSHKKVLRSRRRKWEKRNQKLLAKVILEMDMLF